jgi:hypothetical protein
VSGSRFRGHCRGERPVPGGTVASERAVPTGRGLWFPLLVPGGLTGFGVLLSVLGSPRLPTGVVDFASRVVYPTVTQAMYLGGGAVSGPFPFPLGWYWVGALVASVLVMAAWCRWQDRRSGERTVLRGYVATGLVLAAMTAALPLLAWRAPVWSAASREWAWLDVMWRLGTLPLLAVAVSLGMLARIVRSRALAVITVVYVIAVCLAGWFDWQREFPFPLAGTLTLPTVFGLFGDPGALLPAVVLLLAGLGSLVGAALRATRARHRVPAAG